MIEPIRFFVPLFVCPSVCSSDPQQKLLRNMRLLQWPSNELAMEVWIHFLKVSFGAMKPFYPLTRKRPGPNCKHFEVVLGPLARNPLAPNPLSRNPETRIAMSPELTSPKPRYAETHGPEKPRHRIPQARDFPLSPSSNCFARQESIRGIDSIL